MQKNEKAYVFLFSRSSKSRIYIKRISIPKRAAHLGMVSILLCFGIAGTSLVASAASNIVSHFEFAEAFSSASIITKLSAESTENNIQLLSQQESTRQSLALNSGGPEADNQNDIENNQLESELEKIKQESDPANLPTMWAHLGKINNEFGFRRNPFGGRSYEFHPGMDIDGERGDLVVAPANGTVVKAGWTGGYGNMVEIDHGNGLTTRYGHLSKVEVSVGDVIYRGQLIGYVGSTGRSTGPHLHYELRLNDKPINPRYFLPPEPTDLTALSKK